MYPCWANSLGEQSLSQLLQIYFDVETFTEYAKLYLVGSWSHDFSCRPRSWSHEGERSVQGCEWHIRLVFTLLLHSTNASHPLLLYTVCHGKQRRGETRASARGLVASEAPGHRSPQQVITLHWRRRSSSSDLSVYRASTMFEWCRHLKCTLYYCISVSCSPHHSPFIEFSHRS